MTTDVPKKITLPAMPAVSSELSPDLKEWIEAVTTILEVVVGQGSRGSKNELDRAVTRRDMLEGGLAEVKLGNEYLVPASLTSNTAAIRNRQSLLDWITYVTNTLKVLVGLHS